MKKNKRKRIWLLLILAIIVVAIIVLFFSRSGQIGFDPDRGTINPFPFGDRDPQQTDDQGDLPLIDDGDVTQIGDRLFRERFRQITNFPISGYRSYTNPDLEMLSQGAIATYNSLNGEVDVETLETIPTKKLHYARQEDGVIIKTVVGETLDQSLLVNNILPNAHESFFSSDELGVMYRYFNDRTKRIESFVAGLSGERMVTLCPDIQIGTIFDTEDNDDTINTLKQILREQRQVPDTISMVAYIDEDFQGSLTSAQQRWGVTESGIFDEETLTYIQENICPLQLEEKEEAKEEAWKIDSANFTLDEYSFVGVNPESDDIFGLVRDSSVTVGKTASFEAPRLDRTVLRSAFSEWIPQWPSEDLVTLTTAASGLAEGYVFGLNPSNQKFEKITGGFHGFTTLTSPGGRYVFYSQTNQDGRSLGTAIWDRETNTKYGSPLATLPEKCVWKQDETELFCAVPKNIDRSILPDDWYKGKHLFEDHFWKLEISPESQQVDLTFIYDPASKNKERFDGVNLQLSPDEKFLFLVNKNTNRLWSLEIDGLETNEVARTPLSR